MMNCKKCSACLLFIVLLILTVALPSHADVGDVVSNVNAPSRCPTGLAFDGAHIWMCDRKSALIYELEPASGKVLKTFPAPGYFPGGLGFDGDHLWVTDLREKKIYRMNRETGEYDNELEMPTTHVTGLAFAKGHMYICDSSDKVIASIDSRDGTVIDSFPAPDRNPMGLAFDGKYLWCSDRVKDRIYAIDPAYKKVLFSFNSPGKYAWGLAWDGAHLLNVDYQSRKIYRIKVRDEKKYSLSDLRDSRITFTSTIRNQGPGSVKRLRFNIACPEECVSQKLLSPVVWQPGGGQMLTDQYGQKVMSFTFSDIPPAQSRSAAFTLDARIWALSYFVYPDEVGSMEEIPSEIKSLYLRDESKYDINSEYMQNLVKRLAGNERNPYWRARKLYDYLISHIKYKLEGGWNTAPTVLKRGTGSCSEYSFAYISLCRAAGVPARYLGTVVVRGDDASYDDVFHRWCEIYLPRYGWIPVDANAGNEPMPGDQALSFGGYKNRFLITTRGGGESTCLKWGYNAIENWSFLGKCRVSQEDMAEWEPLGGEGKP